MSLPIPGQLSSFLVVAELSSFSAAARQLGVSAAAVSKSVQQLEKQLGIRLFHRTTRSLQLTDEGRELQLVAQPASSQIGEVLERLKERSTVPSGLLRINVPDSFGRHFIVPLLPDFMARYPQIELDIRFEDRVVDLIAEGFDVGVGNRVNQDSRLVARPLYSMQLATVATPAYLARHGLPTTLDELAQHNCLAFRALGSGRKVPWRFQHAGVDYQVEPQGNVSVSSIDALRELLLADQGIATLGRWHVTGQLESGELVPILPEQWPAPRTVWLYYGARQQVPARVRIWIDYLLAAFAKSPDDRPADRSGSALSLAEPGAVSE